MKPVIEIDQLVKVKDCSSEDENSAVLMSDLEQKKPVGRRAVLLSTSPKTGQLV